MLGELIRLVVMAADEIEYESDPEEARLSLKMRRREASDDEEEAEEGGNPRDKPRRRVESDDESEGAAAEYDEELDEYEEYDLNEYDAEFEQGNDGRGKDGLDVVRVEREECAKEGTFEVEVSGEEEKEGNDLIKDMEEKKEAESFSVPTAGAFYMHDDRFRDNSGGQHRY